MMGGLVVAAAPALRTMRVLVADGTERGRADLARILREGPGLEVVGAARDGEEALEAALRLLPDLVVLELDLPRVDDGLTFLRDVMARSPVPVVVLAAASRPADAFKALELGALDFVIRPESGSLAPVRDLLLERCLAARALRRQNLARAVARGDTFEAAQTLAEPPRVAVVGASTGGPQALLRLLTALPRDVPLGLAIAQHMPERFTAAFAERLTRRTAFAVREAADGDAIAAGRVLLAPGGRHLELARDAGGLRVAVRPAEADARRHCPSVDRLFESAARVLGPRACAVLLTGMGSDGRAGAVAMRRAGGLVLAESEETALVFGMPKAAAEAGGVDELLPLGRIAGRLSRFARAPRPT